MHIIRLRRPWEKEIDGQPTTRVDVPDREADTRDHVCYRRRFNRPSGLTSGDSVWLRITDWRGIVKAIEVNGRPVAISEPPLNADITDLLCPSNELCIRLQSADDGDAAALSGEVSLGIDDQI